MEKRNYCWLLGSQYQHQNIVGTFRLPHVMHTLCICVTAAQTMLWRMQGDRAKQRAREIVRREWEMRERERDREREREREYLWKIERNAGLVRLLPRFRTYSFFSRVSVTKFVLETQTLLISWNILLKTSNVLASRTLPVGWPTSSLLNSTSNPQNRSLLQTAKQYTSFIIW